MNPKKKFKQLLFYGLQQGFDINTLTKFLVSHGFFVTPQHIIEYLRIMDEIEKELHKPIELYDEFKINNLLLKQERILAEVLPLESLKSKFKKLLEQTQFDTLDDIYNQLYYEYRRKLPISKIQKALQSKKFIYDFTEKAIDNGFEIREIINYLSTKLNLPKEKIREFVEDFVLRLFIEPGPYVLPVEED